MQALYGPASAQAGIWRVWPLEAVHKADAGRPSERVVAHGVGIVLYGLYFSLLSAFHICCRDLNVGNWINRIAPAEYTLRATGWVKSVAGVQSLISVYLVALWALSYFGQPFD